MARSKTHKQLHFTEYAVVSERGVYVPSRNSETMGRDLTGAEQSVGTAQAVGRIALGDGLTAMRALPDASFDAIYLDPPFRTGKPKRGDRGLFTDQWPSMDAYLNWLSPFVAQAHRLLVPAGWFWLHLDWHSVHYAKVLTDGIFGARHFRNEIVWHYTGRRTPADRRFNQKHDTLLLYARGDKSRLSPLAEAWSREDYLHMKRQQLHHDPDGREWIWGHAGRGRSKAYRIYVDEQVSRGRAVDSVWDIPIINTSAEERTGYPTQKPVALLERVCRASVPPGGLIGDFMAGSGTTGVAACRTGRRFYLVDRLPEAVQIAEERLAEAGCPVRADEGP
ncbi:MAG: site-specific DNA-methyltransferase [Firmicutes bacterium]|nr:site-specific DNA-methyltransferase [Bacillota bacterium]